MKPSIILWIWSMFIFIFILIFCFFFFFFLPQALEGGVKGEEKERGFLSRCRRGKVIPGSDGGGGGCDVPN